MAAGRGKDSPVEAVVVVCLSPKDGGFSGEGLRPGLGLRVRWEFGGDPGGRLAFRGGGVEAEVAESAGGPAADGR